jgi:hypothetical protein
MGESPAKHLKKELVFHQIACYNYKVVKNSLGLSAKRATPCQGGKFYFGQSNRTTQPGNRSF